MTDGTITVDGSLGEGGGQIVRSSLALSLVTGRAIAIEGIRARRKKPGLSRQHLTAVQAARQISGASVEGAEIRSSRLVFHPGPVAPGEYTFRIGSAGSTTLVLQTILPALMIADGTSVVVLEGGTHNPLAPCYDFLEQAYLPLLQRMGVGAEASLQQPGFYPAGGGRFSVTIHPCRQLGRLELMERGEILRRRVRAIVAKLPRHIAERECETIAKKTNWKKSCFEIEEINDAPGPGNVVMIHLRCEHVNELFTGFGQRGVRAERVASEVLKEARQYIDSGVPVGSYLADQLMLPLAIGAHQGSGGGAFATLALSPHSTTHLEILQKFLDVQVQLDRQPSGNDVVGIEPNTTVHRNSIRRIGRSL